MDKRMHVMKWTTLTCLMGACVMLNVWVLYHEETPFTMMPVPSLVAMLVALMYHDLYRDPHTTLDDAVFYSLIAVAQVLNLVTSWVLYVKDTPMASTLLSLMLWGRIPLGTLFIMRNMRCCHPFLDGCTSLVKDILLPLHLQLLTIVTCSYLVTESAHYGVAIFLKINSTVMFVSTLTCVGLYLLV